MQKKTQILKIKKIEKGETKQSKSKYVLKNKSKPK